MTEADLYEYNLVNVHVLFHLLDNFRNSGQFGFAELLRGKGASLLFVRILAVDVQ